jgi:flavodoxin
VPVRVLVAHATELGSTAEIGDAIAQVLRDDGHDAVTMPARDATGLDDGMQWCWAARSTSRSGSGAPTGSWTASARS